MAALNRAVNNLVEKILSDKRNSLSPNPNLKSRPEFNELPVSVGQPTGEFPNCSGNRRDFRSSAYCRQKKTTLERKLLNKKRKAEKKEF